MEQTYKPSFYNFYIPIEDKNVVLLYNSLVGGLFELPISDYQTLSKVIDNFEITTDNVPKDLSSTFKKLIDSKYIIPSNTDEFQVYLHNYNQIRQRATERGRIAVTITPSLNCNLACRYCFQNGAKAQDLTFSTMESIVNFLDARINEHMKISSNRTFSLTWFGGEPLLAFDKLETYSNMLISLCNKYGYDYEADIITNGTLLTNNVWEIFSRSKITALQVTLDGPASTHNIRRKPKALHGQDYDSILKNLSTLPKNIHLAIRINCDKVVWNNIDTLLDDLEKYEIWPQKASQINIALAFITTHNNARFNDINWKFSYEEFANIEMKFTDIKIRHYNTWAKKNNKPYAKKMFRVPMNSFEECITAVSPYGFVIDTEGYIHKCWEDVDKPLSRIIHVSEPYSINNSHSQKWLSYSRINNNDCIKCKFLPICNSQCTKKMLLGDINKHCTSWRYSIIKEIKQQYIEHLNNPSIYIMP